MTSNAPAPRGNLALGVALGAVVGILVVVFAWLQLVPRTAEPAPDPVTSPTVATTPDATTPVATTPDATSPAPEPSATTPSPTPTASPTPTPEATPSASAPPAGVVTELPAGTFVTVLRSLPQASVSAEEAMAQAAGMGNEQHRPVVLDSNAFGFTPDYWVVAVPGAASSQAAVAVCDDLGISDRNQCYPRRVGD
ncbi:hypothetical protein PCC79_07200 [Propioniciclava soli]|uniref:SPOR domain-containing protein n=1 Tax=Propioniciclava soli TaxID=2775081 RepID=A0ABZ3CB54_9ACTN